MTLCSQNCYWARREKEAKGLVEGFFESPDLVEMERFETPCKYEKQDFEKAKAMLGIAIFQKKLEWVRKPIWYQIVAEYPTLGQLKGGEGDLTWCYNRNMMVILSPRMIRIRDFSLVIEDVGNGKILNRISEDAKIECMMMGTEFIYVVPILHMEGLKTILQFKYL